MNQTNLIARLTGRKLDAALALLDSGAADAALAAQETHTLARRRVLAADLLAAPGLHQTSAAKAAADYAQAVTRRIAAQAALAEAFRTEAATMGVNYSAQYSQVRAVADIEREMLETADSRIGRMLFLLEMIDCNARAALTFYPMGNPTRPGLRVEYNNNMGDVKAARRVIATCEQQCTTLLHAAVGFADSSALLGGMCSALAGPLSLLELNPPQFDAEGRLEAPLPWGATGSLTRWKVAVATPQPRQQEPIVSTAKLGV